MKKENKRYDWGQLYDFEFDAIEEQYDIYVDVSEITKLYNTAFKDKLLGEDNTSFKETPLGINEKSGSEIIKILEWLELARVFRNGAIESFKDVAFSDYRRQKLWYLLASEHDQVPCLVVEMSTDNVVLENDYKLILSSSGLLHDNYRELVANSCFEEPRLLLLEWMKSQKEFDVYMSMYEAIPFAHIERQIAETLTNHYINMRDKNIDCGGIYFEWYSANEGEADAYGTHFTYEVALGDV